MTGFFCLVDCSQLFFTPKCKYFNCEFGASANQEEKATSGPRLTEGFLLIRCPAPLCARVAGASGDRCVLVAQ
jgi:hypothetical protein